MALQDYRRRRNFSSTPEPTGKIKKAKESDLSFVVQKHDASRLHFDFRLEWGGVLKSWAVPKGPSLDPKVRRLAIEVEDHPLEYRNFEGLIPEGEYGAGPVIIWDEGEWMPENDPQKSLRLGKINFVLKGRRLKGAWTLVRSQKPGSKQTQWLLIKRRDEFSTDKDLGLSQKSIRSHRSLEDLRKGLGPKKSLPDFISPQLASLVEAPPSGEEWLHEIKLDGYRIMAFVENGKARLLSRNNLDWTEKLKPIADELEQLGLDSIILDGEVVVLDKEGKSRFQLLQRAFRNRQAQHIVFYLFDLLFLEGKDLRALPLIQRRKLLEQIMSSLSSAAQKKLKLSSVFEGDAGTLFQKACDAEIEGLVSKHKNSVYQSLRSNSWLKSKCRQEDEFLIIGFSEPKNSRAGFGSLLMASRKNSELVYCGAVGTGFSEGDLLDLHRRLQEIELSSAPKVKGLPPKSDKLHWVRPSLVAQIRYAEMTEEGLIRQGVFMGLRNDKDTDEIELPVNMPVEKKSKLKLSHPDKVLIDPDITKREIARYYEKIQNWILPHLAGRPLSLLRCPDGMSKECFYQKRPHGAPDRWLHVRSLEDLLSLIQLGSLEFHIWGSRCENIEQADQIVFDLDPDPKLEWSKLVNAGLLVRDVLNELGLTSFVKTTGGKGFHLVLPLEAKAEWPELKEFCRQFAQSLAHAHPEIFTSNMLKKKRQGKVFIDYLRNARGATAIAPYSTRARRHGPIATPLSWEELIKSSSASAYTLRTLPKRLTALKEDPWLEFFSIKQSLP